MKDILQKFLNMLDWSKLPIGPQADLIEQVKELNTLVPHQFQPLTDISLYNSRGREYWNEKGYEPIKFEVTKKFTWTRNTTDKVRDCIDFWSNLYKHKDFKVRGMQQLFDRTEKGCRTYAYMRFKSKFNEIDKMLGQKRWNNAIWVEDDSTINKMIAGYQNTIHDAFNTFSDYMVEDCAYPKKKMQYAIVPDPRRRKSFYDTIIKDLWKDDLAPAVIALNPGVVGNARTIHPTITMFVQFPKLILNTFRGDSGKTPIFAVPAGKVVAAIGFSFEQLVRYSANLSIGRNTNGRPYVMKFWHKPDFPGKKHPYIQNFQSRDYQTDVPIDDWNVMYENSPNTCFGNINANQHFMKLNFVLWAEEIYTWLTTFRLGTTHPLNNLSFSYWGHPSQVDPCVDDEFMEIHGHDYSRCFSRMTDYWDILERRNVCAASCSIEHRDACDGYKMDTEHLDVAIVQEIFKDSIPHGYDRYLDPDDRLPYDYMYPLVQMYGTSDPDFSHFPQSYTVPGIPSDTIPWQVPLPETSLEGDMREWIRNQ